MGRYSNSVTTLVFSIKIIKSLPKLLVGPTSPMTPLTQMAKVVTSLYTIWMGHYEVWGFLGHGIWIFAYSIYFSHRDGVLNAISSASIFYSICLGSLYMPWLIASIM